MGGQRPVRRQHPRRRHVPPVRAPANPAAPARRTLLTSLVRRPHRAWHELHRQDLLWRAMPGRRSCSAPRATEPTLSARLDNLYGAVVTLTDPSAPTLKIAWSAARGRLAAAHGPGRPTTRRTTAASSSARLEIDGTRRREHRRPCDYRTLPRPVPEASTGGRSPCPAGDPGWRRTPPRGRRRTPPATAASSSGRSSSTDATDRGARACERQARSSSAVSDATSGVAPARIEVRNGSSQPYRTLAAKLENGRLTRQARPRPRLARRHARDGPRRGGQRRAGQPHTPLGHEREDRPALPQGALRPREGALRPRRAAARAAHALRRAVASRARRSSRPRRSVGAAHAHGPRAAR